MSSTQKPIRPVLPEFNTEIREKAQYLINHGYCHDTLDNVMLRLQKLVKEKK
jgi:hypothetical protein